MVRVPNREVLMVLGRQACRSTRFHLLRNHKLYFVLSAWYVPKSYLRGIIWFYEKDSENEDSDIDEHNADANFRGQNNMHVMLKLVL